LAIQLDDVRDSEVEEFGPGEIIYTQGESLDHMFLLLEGEVALKQDGQPVGTVAEGDVFGEMALVDRNPANMMAESVGDVRVLPLTRSRFEALLIQHPEFARTVLSTMCRRLREANLTAGGSAHVARVSDSTSRLLLSMKGNTLYPAGKAIFSEGDKGVCMFFVQDGTVELRVGGKPVQTIETGAFFGEMALIDDAPRSASAHAVTDCRLMPVDRDRFEVLIRRTPDFVIEMMRNIAGRLRAMGRKKA
jgi:CRP/FNR family cyclic AMP-dependent transcriptional regulator